MNTKHIVTAFLLSSALASSSYAELSGQGSGGSISTTDVTTASGSGGILNPGFTLPETLSAQIVLDDSGEPQLCNPDDPTDCGDELTFVYFNAGGGPQKTTKWEYYKCLAKAQAVRTACDVAFAAVQGAASAATGGASSVATTVAGVGIVQNLQACYALYKAQRNGCRIDHGLKPED